ncbi:MAG: hypothetical protein ACQEXB_03890 [Bacillota bacterium]
MGRLENQDGYALVTVLLIITIFMMLFLAFTGQAFNTVKQNQLIEKNSQSVALAEMGVTYYEKAIQNVYYANITDIINDIAELRQKQTDKLLEKEEEFQKLDAEVQQLYLEGNGLDNNDFIKIARNRMERKLICAINPTGCSAEDLSSEMILLNQTVKDKIDSEFEINMKEGLGNLIFSEGNAIIKSDFISTGEEKGDQTSIGALLKMDFSDIIPGNTIRDPDPNGTFPNCDTFSSKFPDFTNTECQFIGNKVFANNDKLKFDNSTVKVNGDFTFENLNNENVNSTLYVDGDLTTNNMTSFQTLNLHVTGDASFGNFTGTGLSKSIIEIDGTTNFSNVKLNESDIYISSLSSTLPNLGKIISMVGSSIYVNSGAIFDDIDIGSNSTICVNGPLTFVNTNGNTSKISGEGKVYATSSTDPKVITNTDLFKSECTKFAWGNATFTAEYDYHYE